MVLHTNNEFKFNSETAQGVYHFTAHSVAGVIQCLMAMTDGRVRSLRAPLTQQPPHHSIFAMHVGSVVCSVSNSGELVFKCKQEIGWNSSRDVVRDGVREVGYFLSANPTQLRVVALFASGSGVVMYEVLIRPNDTTYLRRHDVQGLLSVSCLYKPRYMGVDVNKVNGHK